MILFILTLKIFEFLKSNVFPNKSSLLYFILFLKNILFTIFINAKYDFCAFIKHLFNIISNCVLKKKSYFCFFVSIVCIICLFSKYFGLFLPICLIKQLSKININGLRLLEFIYYYI